MGCMFDSCEPEGASRIGYRAAPVFIGRLRRALVSKRNGMYPLHIFKVGAGSLDFLPRSNE